MDLSKVMELQGMIGVLEGKLQEGRDAIERVQALESHKRILEKGKLILKNENHRLHVRVDELILHTQEQEKFIEELTGYLETYRYHMALIKKQLAATGFNPEVILEALIEQDAAERRAAHAKGNHSK